MMTYSFKNLIRGLAMAAVLILSFFIFTRVHAANPFDIVFPIPELGNCESVVACKLYCDDLSHASQCAAFAEAHGLAGKKDVERAKSLEGKKGPGGCESESACRAYCDDQSHIEECVDFGVKNGFINKDEAAQARKFINKTGPGGCKGEACKEYCENPEHGDECLDFAAKEGLLPREEIERAKKFKQFKEKEGPGGCKGEAECKAYCGNPDHLEECIDFAVKNGFMSASEAARVKSISGHGPGGCRGQGECRAYCEDQSHAEECLNFAAEHGFIDKKDAEKFKKFAGKPGPGGCRGEECRAYCDDSANQEECLDFSIREGFVSKEEGERAKRFINASKESGPGGCKGAACREYCSDISHQKECFEFARKNGLISEQEIKFHDKRDEFVNKIIESGGPGGCKDEESCQEFCSDSANSSECSDFAVKGGFLREDEAKQSLDNLKKFKEFRQRAEAFVERGGEGQEEDFGARGFPPGFPAAGLEKFSGDDFDSQESNGQSFGLPPGFPVQPGQPIFGQTLRTQEFNGPGGCKGPEECFDYCSKPENVKACVATFRRGEVREESASEGPRTGPGGCRGFKECSDFCSSSDNSSECSRFGGGPDGKSEIGRPAIPGPAQELRGGEPLRRAIPFGVPPTERTGEVQEVSPGEASPSNSLDSGEARGSPPEFIKGEGRHGFAPSGESRQPSFRKPVFQNTEPFSESQFEPKRGEGVLDSEKSGDSRPPFRGTSPNFPVNFQKNPSFSKPESLFLPPGQGGQAPPSGFDGKPPQPPQGEFGPSSFGSFGGGSQFPGPSGSGGQFSPPPGGGSFTPPSFGGSQSFPQSGSSQFPPPSSSGGGSFQQPPTGGSFPSSSGGGFSPPPSDEGGSFSSPFPSGGSQPPPPPPPSSNLKWDNFLGLTFKAMFRLFGF